MRTRQLISPLFIHTAQGCVVILAACAGAWSCSSYKNYDERLAAAGERDTCNCIDTCMPDPGSVPVNVETISRGMTFPPYCERATRGFTFADTDLRQKIADFEDGIATNWYTYHDDSTNYFLPPAELLNEAGIGQRGWQPPSQPSDGPCGDSRSALRLWGGPFRSWGGGFGMSMKWLYDQYCRLSSDPPDFCPDPEAEFSEFVLDWTEYEGISFWARRGPDGQSGIRVMAGDKHIDDDLSFLHKKAAETQEQKEAHQRAVEAALAAGEDEPDEPDYDFNPADRDPPYETPLYCERKKECGCTNHKPCSWYTDPGYPEHDRYGAPVPVPRPEPTDDGRWTTLHPQDDPSNPTMWPADDGSNHYCFDPDIDPPPGALDECGRVTKYDVCGRSKCDEAYPAWPEWVDPQFSGRECVPYAFPGSVYGDYCYEPGVDPDPPDNQFLCGDYWFDEVLLTTDWEFYTVPFTDMHQQGWAMESFEFDLSAVSVIRFTWGRGWLDLWLDDVTFYKREP